MTASDDVRVFRKAVEQTLEKAYRKSVLELGTNVTLSTPVDQGVLRNNWFPSIGAPSSAQTEETDISGAQAIARIESTVTRLDLEAPFYLSNNLPYAGPIELDSVHRGKVVRANVAKWDEIFLRNLKRSGS